MSKCRVQDGSMLITYSDNVIQIEVDGRKSINSLVFLEDGKHLLGGGEDGTIRRWRVEDGREIEDQRITTPSAVRAIALSRDGNWIVGAGERVAIVWNRRTRQVARTVSEHSGWVNTVDVSPDSTKFATGSDDKKVTIWDISNGRRLVGPLQHCYPVIAVRFSPDGDCIAVAQRNYCLTIYDAYGGLTLERITTVSLSQNSPIAWLGNSRRIFTLSGNQIRLFRDTKVTAEWKIPGHSDDKNSWSTGISLPSNKKFIAAFTGRVLTFWNLSTRERLGPIFEHRQVDKLYSITLSPDNNYVATGSNDGIIILRNLNDIIPSSLNSQSKVSQREVRTPVEAHQVTPRALELRSGAFYCNTICIPPRADSHQTSRAVHPLTPMTALNHKLLHSAFRMALIA